MTDKVHTLGVVPKPCATEESRQATIEVLARALARAKEVGSDVEECLVILKHAGEGDYTVSASETNSFTGWIGKIEALKFEWLLHHAQRSTTEG